MFIDSNIFIHAALGRDKKAVSCREFLQRVQTGEQNSHCSVLVLEETLKAISLLRDEDSSVKAVSKFLRLQNLHIHPVDMDDLSVCFKFFTQSMDVHDSLHLAVMKKHKISTILSYDKDFDNIKGIKRVEP